MRLVQLAPGAIGVQDDIGGPNVPPIVHFNVLVEASEVYVLAEVGQVRT